MIRITESRFLTSYKMIFLVVLILKRSNCLLYVEKETVTLRTTLTEFVRYLSLLTLIIADK